MLPMSVLALLVLAALAARAEPREPDALAGTWRVEFDNDLFFDSDNNFTSGISVQRHSRLATRWEAIPVPSWTKFGRGLPGLGGAELHRRVSFAAGQNLQTPDDLTATELIADDVPYAAALGFELGWSAFNDATFRGYSVVAGFIGPMAGGRQVQDFVHRFGHSDKALGWDNQLGNELVVNFNGMFKKKLGRIGNTPRWSADLAVDADFGIGTALTFAETALELRAGFNVPEGFAFVPDPIGRTIAHDATWRVESRDRPAVYVSVVARAVAMPYFIFLDGSLFRDGHSIARDETLIQLITGLHIDWRNWSVHFSSWRSSRGIRSATAPDPNNDFGTIAIDWRF